jgi:hypothetical protein
LSFWRSTGEPARDPHACELPGLVHTAQTEDASMYGGRRSSRRHASVDRMGGGNGEVKLRGTGTLPHAVPLAVSPLHGYRVDVPRGLLTGRILGSSPGTEKGALYVLAGSRGLTCSCSSKLEPSDQRRQPRLLCCDHHTELRVFLVQRPSGLSKIKRLGAPTADGFNHISAADIRPDGAG